MQLALFPPLIVALATFVLVAWARRLRPGKKRWPLQAWFVLPIGGVVAAAVVRATEAIVIDVAVGGRLTGAEGVRIGLVAFGIVGPLTVLTLAALVWPVVKQQLVHEVDPPLAAAVSAAGFVIGRSVILLFIEHVQMRSGVRAAILGLDDIALAATWGYGLARSNFDGQLGGTPFGRYALGTMLARGAAEYAIRTRAPVGTAFMIGLGLLAAGSVTMGLFRLSDPKHPPVSSLASVGQETIREIARAQLRRGGVRPLWIVLGAFGNLGGMIVGFGTAVLIGRSAHIDFGEIDRSGPAAEYAALLLALGVIMSFPMSAAVVGLAGGGRNAPDRAYVLEAGLSAMVALVALLALLGVVAPVAVAVGIACAPVAFVLAGIGAWIAAGRRN
jgi:hypothetical protein